MSDTPKKSILDPEVESIIPPERFKNLWRDAGINSVEALARAYQYRGDENGNIHEVEAEKAKKDSKEKKPS